MKHNPLLLVRAMFLGCSVLVAAAVIPSNVAVPSDPADRPEQTSSPLVVSLVINEYLADPPDGVAGDANGDGTRDSSQDEFVEIVNSGPDPLPVGGFTISDAAQVRFTIPAGKTIPPGEAAIIFGGGTPMGAFGNCAANGLVFVVGGGGLSLNNGGDMLSVKDSAALLVATLTYGSTEGNANQSITRSPDVTGNLVFHSSAPGSVGALFSPGTRITGSAFTTTDPVIDSISPVAVVAGSGAVTMVVSGQNFQNGSTVLVDASPVSTVFSSTTELQAEISQSVTSSPGTHLVTVQNPDLVVSNPATFVVLSAIGLNEFLADPPDGPAGDANGDGVRDTADDEFVEVVNRTNAPVEISGFKIHDAAAVRFTFPAGTVIPAGESAVVFGGGSPAGEFGNAGVNGLVFVAGLSLNNTGDTITITDSGGITVESVSYGSSAGNANEAFNRDPDLVGTTFVRHSSVVGGEDRLFSPGTFVNGQPFTSGPRISGIEPDHVPHSAPVDVIVDGDGFEADSAVAIDSLPVPTTFLNVGRLAARVPASVTSVAGPHSVNVRNGGGNRSNAVTLIVVPPPPLVSSVVPRFVVVGEVATVLLVSGEHFDPGARVVVEDTLVATTFTSSGELRAVVPGSLTATVGPRSLHVRNGDGRASNLRAFEVIHVSSRTVSTSPAATVAGGPGFVLTVRGTNFKSGAFVLFDQTPLVTKFVSATELQAEVPAALIAKVGLRAISAQNPEGNSSDEVIFRVIPDAPLLTAIDPSSVLEGSGMLTVAITGEKFQPGVLVRASREGRGFVVVESNLVDEKRIDAKVPADLLQTAGSVGVTIENPDFGVSNIATIKVLIKDPLVINEFLADPADTAAGDANGDATRSSSQDEFIEIVNRTAEAFDVAGYKILDTDALRHVFAPGTVIPAFEAVVVFGGGSPRGAFGNAGENQLVLKASTGGLSLNNGGDTIKLEDPQGRIVQQIKFGAAEGGADQSINRDPDLGGATFGLHTRVAQDGANLFSPGARSNGVAFTTKPRILALGPATVRLGSPAFTLVATGSEFLPGAVVVFGDSALETRFRSSTHIEAQVAPGLLMEGGSIQVRVRNPKGELSSIARFVVADDPPRLLNLLPARTGTGAENLELRIDGERFQRGAHMTINGEPVQTRFVTSTLLETVAPEKFFKVAAELELQAINGDGNPSNLVTLSVANGPLITRLSRKRIKAGRGDVEITVGGIAFQPGVVLLVNESPVTSSFLSGSSFVARVPAPMASQPGKLTLQARNSDGGRSNKAILKIVE